MRIVGQGFKFIQPKPKYYGIPMGATLGDELGGVGYIGADGTTQMIVPTDYVMPKPDYTRMNPMPLPLTDSDGNIIMSTGATPTSISSSGDTVNKETDIKKVEGRRVTDDKIIGMPKNVAIVIGLAAILIGGYFAYTKLILKK